MGILSLLHHISFILYLTMVIYILTHNPKPLIKKLCAGFISCLALWSFVNIYIHNTTIPMEQAVLFSKIAGIGWIGFSFVFLWFVLVFGDYRQVLDKKYFLPLLMVLPLTLIFANWMGVPMTEMQLQTYGWRLSWISSFWVYLFFVYYISYMSTGLLVVFKISRSSTDLLKQKQARIIFYATATTLILGTITDVVLPLVGVLSIPSMAEFFGLIWAAGLAFAMVRHKFLALKPATPVSNIKTTMFDCLLLLSSSGIILSLNEAVSQLLGYKEEELRGRSLELILGEEDSTESLMEEIISNKFLKNRNLVFKSSKGKRIPVTFSSSLLQDDKGRVEEIICVARDLTELIRNELIQDVLFQISETTRRTGTLQELLQQIQQQVAKLMDARNFYVALVHDRDKSLYTFPFIVDINPEELEEPDTPIPLINSLTDYVLRSEQPLLANEKTFKELEEKESVSLIGARSKAWMGVPLKTSDDKALGVVVVQSYSHQSEYSESDKEVLSIISNTIAGAIKFKQAEEALRESEEHYRILVDNIQDGVFLIYKGKLEFANDSFARMIGYPQHQLKNSEFNNLISPDDRALVIERHNKRLNGEDVPNEYEFRLRHMTGSDVYVNMHVGLLKYKDGYAGMGTVKDVSERIHAEYDRRELEEKLARSEKMEAIGQLAGGVAHDLNNVLSAIVSYPDLLLMKMPKDSPFRKSILTMQKSGQKAAAIVQDLLTLARRGVHVMKPVKLNKIVNDYMESPEFKKLSRFHPHVQIIAGTNAQHSYIKGSSVHLSKTVMNLVSNATEAIVDHGRVIISTESRKISEPKKGYYHVVPPGDYVVLSVSDTGIGISKEDLAKIFDPFYTKKDMGRSGTGLGMSVVWGTVEDHKGFIDVSSKEGEGTTFLLYFSVTTEQSDSGEVFIPIDSYRGKGEKILVVDDDPDQREIADVLLNELGYTVEKVSSGEAAIDYMLNNDAQLILLDMLMTGIDGLDTYKEILKIRPAAKAIIVSGFSESTRVKEALTLGACGYIKKPYTIEKIGLALSRGLNS